MTTTKGWGGKRDGAGRRHQSITIRMGQTIYLKTNDGEQVEGKVTDIDRVSFTAELEDYRTINVQLLNTD